MTHLPNPSSLYGDNEGHTYSNAIIDSLLSPIHHVIAARQIPLRYLGIPLRDASSHVSSL